MWKLFSKGLPTMKRKLPNVSFSIFIQEPEVSL